MEHFVYIILSTQRVIYYRGYSTDPYKRVYSHNNNESRFTKNKGPWKLVYIEVFETKKQALLRERALKKYSHSQIQQLIQSPKNILKEL